MDEFLKFMIYIVSLVISQLTLYKLIFTVFGWFAYKLLFKPINYIKRVEDIGVLDKKKYFKSQRHVGKIPPVYPNGWFVIAESSNMKKNEVQNIVALGENLVLFRSGSGKARVLDAYCPHLGANFAVGGTVHGECLQCPFHLWTFDGESGICTSIPNNEKIPKSAKVRSWKTYETNGFIFLWYDAESEEPAWYPEGIDVINNNEYKFFGRNEFYANCHIQEVPENGSDMAHFRALHGAAMFSGGDIRYHETIWCKFFRHHWQAIWEPCNGNGKQHIAISSIQHYVTLFGRIKVGQSYIDAYQIGPGYVVLRLDTSLGVFYLLQAVTPVEPLVQKIVHRIYAPIFLFPYARIIFIAECYMIERDIMVWNNKEYLDQPIYTKEDKYIAKFRRWYQQFYSSHSKTYAVAKEGLDW